MVESNQEVGRWNLTICPRPASDSYLGSTLWKDKLAGAGAPGVPT